MVKTPSKPERRLIPVRSVEAARQYITVQGEVVNCANFLHDAFYQVFLIAMALERSEGYAAIITFNDHALAIWHVIQSDSLQRDMAMEAISTVPTKLRLGPALRRLKWASAAARTLTSYRNILAHNSIIFSVTKPGPKPQWVPIIGGRGSRPQHQRRIDMMRGIASWRRLAADLMWLYWYVENVNQQIQRMFAVAGDPTLKSRVRISWPRRPRLRSLSRAREIERALSQATPPTKRRTRWRPSRP
jgi:hypothetical protein